MNGRSQHKLIAQKLDGLAHSLADNGFSRARDEPLHRLQRIAALGVTQFDDAACQHQAPGRGVDKEALRSAEMFLPGAARNLVGDKIIGRLAVGYAQQSLGEAHENDALVARKAVLVHECVDASVSALVGARGVNEAARVVSRTAALVFGEHGALDQTASKTMFVHQIMGGDFVPCGQIPGRRGRVALQGRGHAVSFRGQWRTHTIRLWLKTSR